VISVQRIAGDSDPKHLYRVQSGMGQIHDHEGKAQSTFYVIASSPTACFEFITQKGEEGDFPSHVNVELVAGSVFDVDVVEEQVVGTLR